MKFNYQGNKITIEFEERDSDNEKRMVEQGLAFIKAILNRVLEIKDGE